MSGKKPLLQAVTTASHSRTAGHSPERPPSPAASGGHLHATRVALAMIFERARQGNGTLSPRERVLATVCELRSTLAAGEWLGRLKANGLRELAIARFALNEVGAMSVAAYISDTMAALRRANLVRRRQALLSKLEQDLTAAGPQLDRLIAKFAQNLLAAGGSAEPLRRSRHRAAGAERNHWSSWMRDMKRCGTGRRCP